MAARGGRGARVFLGGEGSGLKRRGERRREALVVVGDASHEGLTRLLRERCKTTGEKEMGWAGFGPKVGCCWLGERRDMAKIALHGLIRN